MKKHLTVILLIHILNMPLHADPLDRFFDSSFTRIYLETKNIDGAHEPAETAYNLNGAFTVLKEKKGESRRLVIMNARTNEEEYSFDPGLPVRSPVFRDEIFINDEQDKAVYSIWVYDKSGDAYFKRIFFDLDAMRITAGVMESSPRKYSPVVYWKRGRIYYADMPVKMDLDVQLRPPINLDMHSDSDPVTVTKIDDESESDIDRFYTGWNSLRSRCRVLSSWGYGFYTKPLAYDEAKGFYQMGLFACDQGNNLQSVKIGSVKETDFFDITHIEGSSQDREYIIVFGKHYGKNGKGGCVNFMALVRVSDLSVRLFPIANSTQKDIILKYGQYFVEDDRIIFANSQDGNVFVTIVFKYEQK